MSADIVHQLDFDKPAKLIRADTISQFGEGYRQVSGPTIAEGSVIELLEKALAAGPHERLKLFISNGNSNPRSVNEAQTQARAGGFSVGGG